MVNLYRRPLHIGAAAWKRGVAASNNGFTKLHPALDIAAARRTPVYSIRAGRVIQVGYDRIRGHFIRIQHSKGVVSKFEHLDEPPKLKVGQRVTGLWRRIGYVGQSGTATGSHLHFAIAVKDVPVDPDPWLRKH
jgi:murein DD-endopeptidase MepM/ murein hydrolase activator NlpD